MNKYAKVKIQDFTNKVNHRTNAYKRRIESLKGKSTIAINMIQRAITSGLYADYVLVDSWYSI
jgi:SRSO17 transposase